MKKMLLSAIAVLFSVGAINGQAVDQGDVIIDAFYGFPNLWGSTVKTLVENDVYSTGVKVTNIGPTGGRLEYMVSPKTGIGVEFSYTTTNASYKYTNALDNMTYDYKLSMPKIRVLPTFNFHLGESDKFDPYFVIGAGYSGRTIKYSSNDPNEITDNFSFNLFPIALKAGFGGRYFFTDNIGMNMQFSLGGPLITAGLSAKF